MVDELMVYLASLTLVATWTTVIYFSFGFTFFESVVSSCLFLLFVRSMAEAGETIIVR